MKDFRDLIAKRNWIWDFVTPRVPLDWVTDQWGQCHGGADVARVEAEVASGAYDRWGPRARVAKKKKGV